MLVKIGDQLYDSSKEPIMIIVGNEEKAQIGTMPNKKFCSFPEDSDLEKIRDFMKVPDDVLKLVNYDELINYGDIKKATK